MAATVKRDGTGSSQSHKNHYFASDESASTKLWTVYVSEAEKYDKALVESWRSDMDGMLIFAGLFSASLTAFLIESYKNLTLDSAASTVLLLKQISLQLATSANGTTVDVIASPATYGPTTTSLVCNALWFISLGLSLSCALVATLLEQWARAFLHRSDMRSAPVARARIFSYLYYGLKRFNMHAVVDIIPLLLHSSLFFFLAGLVAFLAPVNAIIMTIAAALLAIVAVAYLSFTVLPLVYLDCPYRTPFSNILWSFAGTLRTICRRRIASVEVEAWSLPPQSETIDEAIFERATRGTAEQEIRDRRALIWTMKSLPEDAELEPFVEGIPDALWGPHGQLHAYVGHITELVHNQDTLLWSRIQDLLRRSHSGMLSSEAATRRQITCFKALSAIASLAIHVNSQRQHPFTDLSLFSNIVTSAVTHYSVSACALLAWSAFCAFKTQVADVIKDLVFTRNTESSSCFPDIGAACHRLGKLHECEVFRFLPFLFRRMWSEYLHQLANIKLTDDPLLMENVLESFRVFCADINHIIMFEYLEASTSLDSLPYQFDRNISIIQPQDTPRSYPARSRLASVVTGIISEHLGKMNSTPEVHWIDKILGILVASWRPYDHEDLRVPRSIIGYLIQRNSDAAVKHVVTNYGRTFLWSCIAATLGPAGDCKITNITSTEALTVLWRLCIVQPFDFPSLSVCESTLSAVIGAGSSPISSSVIPLIKSRILDYLPLRNGGTTRAVRENTLFRLGHPIFPRETAVQPELEREYNRRVPVVRFSGLDDVLDNRIAEARITVLTEFFENCCGSVVPYNAGRTLSTIDSPVPSGPVHPTHQIRFATSIHRMFQAALYPDLLERTINCKVFDVYVAGSDVQTPAPDDTLPYSQNMQPWLDDFTARKTIRDSFAGSVVIISFKHSIAVTDRVNAVLRGLESLHPSPT